MEREIIIEVRKIISMLRNIIENDKYLLSLIDEDYEQILLDDLRLMPAQFDEQILMSIKILVCFMKSIDVKKLLNEFTNIGLQNNINIDVYKMVVNNIKSINYDNDNKQRVLNIITKLKPLFVVINKLISEPYTTLNKLNKQDDLNIL